MAISETPDDRAADLAKCDGDKEYSQLLNQISQITILYLFMGLVWIKAAASSPEVPSTTSYIPTQHTDITHSHSLHS